MAEELEITQETTQPEGGIEELKKLHQALASDNVFKEYIPQSFDEFIQLYKAPSEFKKLHSALVSDVVFKDYVPATVDESIEYYGLSPLLKKKEPSTPPVSPISAVSGSEVQSTLKPELQKQAALLGIKPQPTLLENVMQEKPTERQKAFSDLAALKNDYISAVRETKKEMAEKERKEFYLKSLEEKKKSVYEGKMDVNEIKEIDKEINKTKEDIALLGLKGSERIEKQQALNTSFGMNMAKVLKAGSANWLSSLSDSPAFLYDLFATPQNKIVEAIGRPDLEVSSKGVAETYGLGENELAKKFKEISEDESRKAFAKYERGFIENFEKGNYKDAIEQIALSVGESAPSTMAIMAASAYGITPIQIAYGGGVLFGAGKKRELDENPATKNMSEADKTQIAFMNGLLEGFFEADLGLSKLSRIFSNFAKTATKQETAEFAKKTFMQVYAPVIRQYLGSAFEESLGEGATTFSQNAIDKYYGVDPDRDLYEGVPESLIIGGAASFGLAAPPTLYQLTTTAQNRAKALDIEKKKQALTNDLTNQNIPDDVKGTIANAVKEVNKEEGKVYEEEKVKFDKLTDEGKVRVVELNTKVAEIDNTLNDPELSNLLSEETKSVLENQKKEAERAIEEIVSSETKTEEVQQLNIPQDEKGNEKRDEQGYDAQDIRQGKNAFDNQVEVGTKEKVVEGGVTAPTSEISAEQGKATPLQTEEESKVEGENRALANVEATAKALSKIKQDEFRRKFKEISDALKNTVAKEKERIYSLGNKATNKEIDDYFKLKEQSQNLGNISEFGSNAIKYEEIKNEFSDIDNQIENPDAKYKRGKQIGEEPFGKTYEADGGGILYRGVSKEDYERIQKQGFIDTDLRGVISDREGINLGKSPSTSANYLPNSKGGYIIAIDPKGLKLFSTDSDNYIRTHDNIPIENIVKVSEFIGKDDMGRMYKQSKFNESISEAYHKAKADGSNPELVKAVEELLGKQEKVTPQTEEESKDIAEQSEIAKTDILGNKIGSDSYKKNAQNSLIGRTRERTLPDGTKLKGTYKIVSSDDILASHNEETFAKTKGFPVNENGKTVNDRDYERDKLAQSEVVRIANSLDERAVSQTPTITKDGIVVDGNNRTMSRKLAAKQGTDKQYLDALKSDADMYGINPSDIDNVKNPILVFETEDDIPYTTKEFARFNKAEKKEKSPIEKAVEFSKTISDRARRIIANIYENAEKPSDITSNKESMKDIKNLLIEEGVFQTNEIPRYINPETGTATKEGVAFLETLLIGSALDESTIRLLNGEGMGTIRNIIIKNVVPITQNASLGENSLQSNIQNGVKLLATAKATDQSVIEVVSQMDMFDVSEYSPEDLAIAIMLDGEGLKNFITTYNSEVGTESLFEGTMTKEKIIDNVLNQKIKNYEQVRKNLQTDATKRKGAVQEVDGNIGKETATKPQEELLTPKQEEYAVQEQSAEETVSRIGETGQNIPESREGIRPSEQREEATQESQAQEKVEVIAQQTGTTAKNIKDLYNINRNLFGLDRTKSLSSAIAMDRMVGAMAKRAGVTKEQMYGRLEFRKDTEQNVLKADNALFQGTVDGKPVTLRNIDVDVVNGFYSPLEKIISETKQEKMPAKQWLDKFARGEEAKWTGLQDWLSQQQGSISKQDILNYLKDNRIGVVEVVKSGKTYWDMEDYENFPKEVIDIIEKHEDDNEAIANDLEKLGYLVQMSPDFEIQSFSKEQSPPKFSQYQLEGEKDNYKEVLVTLPSKGLPEGYEVETVTLDNGDVVYRANGDRLSTPHKTYQEAENELKERAKDFYGTGKLGGAKFKSTHFSEPDILVHLRMNTRIGTWEVKKGDKFIDGNGNLVVATENTTQSGKVLFLEEIQSDWGQKGKKEGFRNEKEKSIYNFAKSIYNIRKRAALKSITAEETNRQLKSEKVLSESQGITQSDIEKALDKYGDFTQPFTEGIPTAPFVMDTNAWTKLGLKVALKEAVAQGVDKIAWTTGEQQNDRYDLSTKVDEVWYKNGRLVVTDKHGIEVIDRKNVSENELPNIIGKEASEKLVNQKEEDGAKILNNTDLKIGGKGMKGFYGSIEEGTKGIVGGVAEKLFGQKVGETKINKGTDDLTKNEALDLLRQGEKIYTYNRGSIFRLYDEKDINEANNYFSKKGEAKSTQPSIDVTPALRAEVERGLALFQRQQGQRAKGAMVAADGTFVIYALTDPNVSTPLHEMAHVFEHYLNDAERTAVQNWVGTKAWTTQTSEAFARGFEKYLAEGTAPTLMLQKIFDKFKQWMLDIYNGIVGSEIDIELNEPMRQIYSSMLGVEIQPKEKVEAQPTAPTTIKITDENVTKGLPTSVNKALKGNKTESATALRKIKEQTNVPIDNKQKLQDLVKLLKKECD